MMEQIPGIEYDFGAGRVYTLAALSFASMIRLQKGLAVLPTAEALNPESITTILETVYASLGRNYPNLSRDDVAELVDLANMFDVLGAVLDVSGIKRKAWVAEQAEKNQHAQQTTAVTPALTGQP